MHASDWREVVPLVSEQNQAAATAETEQLSSLPLSTLPVDDSGPPVVQHGTHMLLATSTPKGTAAHMQSTQQDDLSADHPRCPTGFIIPHFIFT